MIDTSTEPNKPFVIRKTKFYGRTKTNYTDQLKEILNSTVKEFCDQELYKKANLEVKHLSKKNDSFFDDEIQLLSVHNFSCSNYNSGIAETLVKLKKSL